MPIRPVPVSLLTYEAIEQAYIHRYTPNKCNCPDAVVILDAIMEASGGEVPTFPMLPFAESYFCNLAHWFLWAVPQDVVASDPASSRLDRTYLYAIKGFVGTVSQYWGVAGSKSYGDRCRTLAALDKARILPERPIQ